MSALDGGNWVIIFVLPSLSEGFPTSILEAMFFGLPII
jgi:glycosyltransferase involved in cell wall biosynthesis